MPLTPYTPGPVELRVPNLHFGDQQLGQLARLLEARFIIDPVTHELSVILNTQAKCQNLVAGALAGPADPGKVIARPVPIFGNNNCIVYANQADLTDPRNGDILFYKSIQERDGDPFAVVWQRTRPDGTTETLSTAEVDALPEPMMLQGNALAEQLADLFQLALFHIYRAAHDPEFRKYD
ncbi:MAG: hypothetical protein JWP58_3276 [Hymenobacter sp.]|nr:hypothetical protein [Hymenobacter sp.]